MSANNKGRQVDAELQRAIHAAYLRCQEMAGKAQPAAPLPSSETTTEKAPESEKTSVEKKDKETPIMAAEASQATDQPSEVASTEQSQPSVEHKVLASAQIMVEADRQNYPQYEAAAALASAYANYRRTLPLLQDE